VTEAATFEFMPRRSVPNKHGPGTAERFHDGVSVVLRQARKEEEVVSSNRLGDFVMFDWADELHRDRCWK
jgi:hypothetical protein